MLIISCDMHKRGGLWLPVNRKCQVESWCDEGGEVFYIPRHATEVTVSLHTTPAKERVQVAVESIGSDHFDYYISVDEHGVYPASIEVGSLIWRAIRKYKGKPLYLEVTY